MNLGYMAKPYDSNTGLYNYGYRDYKPEAARFTTVDPIYDGSNWFVYVNNDPVNYVDLWGLLSKEDHYARNQNNTDLPPTKEDAMNDPGWRQLPEDQDVYHEMGTSDTHDPSKNDKFVSTDGHKEAVYNEHGQLVTDPVNQGTYNFKDPTSDPVGHFFDDVVPYYKWGNTPDDPTTTKERMGASYEGDVSGIKNK